MNTKFEDCLAETFEELCYDKFKVNLEVHHLFVCGGLVDIKSVIPPSFRHRFISYSAQKNPQIHDSIVQAETFKDYFKENAYPDLLVFEEEIANIASLVIIFLESPGSLVELGMFCTKPDFYKKLVIIAPQEQVHAEDSFIYLGPLENIKKKEPTSVLVYPWPCDNTINYDTCHLMDLCLTIEDKLSSIAKNVAFNAENSGHMAFLIAEIIRINYPILIGEIELALIALGINIKQSDINRHIYLLNKLDIIHSTFYSGYRYYYPDYNTKQKKLINFSKLKTSRNFDEQAARMKIIQSFIIEEDAQSRKRTTALKQITERFEVRAGS